MQELSISVGEDCAFQCLCCYCNCLLANIYDCFLHPLVLVQNNAIWGFLDLPHYSLYLITLQGHSLLSTQQLEIFQILFLFPCNLILYIPLNKVFSLFQIQGLCSRLSGSRPSNSGIGYLLSFYFSKCLKGLCGACLFYPVFMRVGILFVTIYFVLIMYNFCKYLVKHNKCF